MTVEPVERPIDETLFERRMQAVSLRNAQMTFSQIAAIQGISPAMVRRDVEQALRELASGQMDMLIARHRSIVNDALRANYPAMLDGNDRKAQVAATKAIFDGMAHEAKLLGMYAPTRVVTGVGEVEFSERFVELVKAVSPDTLKELLRGHDSRRPADSGDGMPSPDTGTIDAEVIDLPGAEPSGALAAPHGGTPGGPAAPQAGHGGGDGPATTGGSAAPEPGGDDGWSNIGN